MKNIYGVFFILLLCTSTPFEALAQVEVQQRVERYLYTNYTTNKALLIENERVIRILEERLDTYMAKLDKVGQEAVRGQDKEMKAYLQKVEDTKDVKQLRAMVEESRIRQQGNLDRFVEKGLLVPKDALECHKIIIMKLAENELISMKQEKLMALLKDDNTRISFIQKMISNTAVETTSDVKAFAQVVDREVDGMAL